MIFFSRTALIVAMASLCACETAQTSDVVITEVSLADVPSSLLEVIAAERSDFQIEEVLKKVRDGRTYYDVEGEIGDGSELEFDILMTENGPEIVEIQRDLEWSDLDEAIQKVSLDVMNNKQPVRIIESVQTDGAIIYELFKDGKPSDPAQEIRVYAGEVTVLDTRWEH